MSRIHAWLVLGTALIALTGCASWFKGHQPETKPGDRQPAYVDRVDGPTAAPANQPLVITVAGSLPTPAWKLDDVQIARDGAHVMVTLWSHLARRGPVVEMIVPFTKTISLQGLTPGHYDVEVVGRANTTKHLSVEIQAGQ